MKVCFRKTLEDIQLFTLGIRSQTDLECSKCQTLGQFLPHGWLYKTTQGVERKVGKRIICDSRRGGIGCGATTRILVESETYRLWVDTKILLSFLQGLIAGLWVTEAYVKATGTNTGRNAWRWWAKLKRQQQGLRDFLFSKHGLSTQTAEPTEPQNDPLILVTEQKEASQKKNSPVQKAKQDKKCLLNLCAEWLSLSEHNDPCADVQFQASLCLL
jgi:hypothetical protein